MNVKKTEVLMCVIGLMFSLSLRGVNANCGKTLKLGDPVDSGYLFYDGKYIPLPYEFTRKGFSVFVNGCKVYFPQVIIKHLLRNRDSNVDISSIPKNISFDDFLNPEKPWAAYVEKAIENIRKNKNNNQEKIIDIYRKLPFVKNVVLHPIDGIIVETFKGDKTIVDTKPLYAISPKKASGSPTKSSVKRFIEKECADKIKKDLKKGCCVFIFSDTPERRILSPDDVKNNLPEIIDVLNSKDSDNLKIYKLYRLRVFSARKNEKAKVLVDNFKFSKQLSCRIAHVLHERKTTNFKRVKIEEKPTKEELMAAKKQAFENAQKRWREKHSEEYKRKEECRARYFEKILYIRKQGEEYWKTHKKELKNITDEIKRLKAQM